MPISARGKVSQLVSGLTSSRGRTTPPNLSQLRQSPTVNPSVNSARQRPPDGWPRGPMAKINGLPPVWRSLPASWQKPLLDLTEPQPKPFALRSILSSASAGPERLSREHATRRSGWQRSDTLATIPSRKATHKLPRSPHDWRFAGWFVRRPWACSQSEGQTLASRVASGPSHRGRSLAPCVHPRSLALPKSRPKPSPCCPSKRRTDR